MSSTTTTNTQFKNSTTGEEVVAAFPERVAGRIFLVTGPNPGGVGAGTLAALAKGKPAALVLAGRTPAKFQEIVDEIKRIDSGIKVVVITLDLSSQESVRKAAKDILDNADIPRIDILVNNAAVMACPFGVTADGIELQFGTNHVGHFLLTNLLLPKLRLSSEPIIVNLSSSGHRFFKGDYSDVNWKDTPYDKWTAYGQAKAANIFFTKSLAARGLRSIAVHPGWVITNLGRHMEDEDLPVFLARAQQVPDFDPLDFQKTPTQGASSSLVAALDPKVPNGVYVRDCQVAAPAAFVNDEAIPPALWKISNELVGENFA